MFVQIHAAPEAIEDPSNSLLADLDEILPLAISTLAPAGFEVAFETGTTMLFTLQRPADPADDARHRRDVLRAVAELDRRLKVRPDADPAVQVRLYVHAGELAAHDGEALGGDLLQAGAWVPEIPASGPIVSWAALAGLDVATGARLGTDGWFDLNAALAGGG